MKKILVVHHSADYDGIFCREIARKFLPDAELIGWDFGDAPLTPGRFASYEHVYVLDLPIDRPFAVGFSEEFTAMLRRKVTWIDHHKSSIESHPTDIPGYRIEGVAACRLAYQWFIMVDGNTQYGWDNAPDGIRRAGVLPHIEDYKSREVNEPYAVRLAGEHDIWDHRDPNARLLQLGLSSKTLTDEDWKWLLMEKASAKSNYEFMKIDVTVMELCHRGGIIQPYLDNANALKMKNAFMLLFEDTSFLAINSISKGSLQFAPIDTPDSKHDALLKFHFNGNMWEVTMYHSAHRKDVNLLDIAKTYGGGGHPGSCGFVCKHLPFKY